MLTEAQNYAVVRTELDGIFFQEFEYDATDPGIATANTASIFKPMTIDRQAYIEEVFKGSTLFGVTAETQNVDEFVPAVANKLTSVVLDFTKGVELSKNYFDDNMFGVYSRIVADLARIARVSQDQNAFGLFRGAFTTTLTADGAALVSASHTLINGATLSNLITGALSPTTLNNGIVALREQKNQAGVIMGNVPRYLLVPSALHKHAMEITDSALLADNANNNINVFSSAYNLEVLSSPWLGAAAGGSDTAWFLLSRNHGVTRIIRQGLQTNLRDWGYSINRTYFYQANFREVVKCADYIGIVGSTGV